jgi:hypothetical protein
MAMDDECRLEEAIQSHRIGAQIFTPFAVERLRGENERNHTVLAVNMRDLDVTGDRQRNLRLSWSIDSIPVQPLAIQERTITEWAACGVACAVVSVYTKLNIRSVAAEGDSFDYWIGNNEYELGLEVSGTLMADTADIEARHRSKVRQLLANPYGVGGYVIVVGFTLNRVIFSYHDAEEVAS